MLFITLLFGCIRVFLCLFLNWFLPTTCIGGATSLWLWTLRTTKLSNSKQKQQRYHYTSNEHKATHLLQYRLLTNYTKIKICLYVNSAFVSLYILSHFGNTWQHWAACSTHHSITCYPFPTIDCIRAMTFVWTLRGKNIRNVVLCCV